MNQVVLIGRLANDPELSYTPNNQTAVCRFTLAVSRMRREDPADFIRITVWGKQAENCERYLSKGRQAAVHGRIQTGSYTNREGAKVYTTEVVAQNVEFLGGGNSGNGGESFGGGRNAVPPQFTQEPAHNPEPAFGGFEPMPDSFQAAEDDIPF